MNFDYLILSNSEENDLKLIFSTVDISLEELILDKLKASLESFEEKKELLVPFLEIQKYVFFYKVQTNKTLIFCILTESENYNYFFNEIPFIKFKSHQLGLYVNTTLFSKLQINLKEWFDTYVSENNNLEKDYSNILKNKDNFEILFYFLITGKKIFFLVSETSKFEMILPFIYSSIPHRVITIQYFHNTKDLIPLYEIFVSNEQIKLPDDFVLVNLNKGSISFKNNTKIMVTELLTKIGDIQSLDYVKTKQELRSIIIDALDLLVLFRNGNNNDDVAKTKFIETTKKSIGLPTFHLVVDITKSIKHDI